VDSQFQQDSSIGTIVFWYVLGLIQNFCAEKIEDKKNILENKEKS